MENSGYARHSFAAEIERLEHDLLQMGSRAESMVGQAVDALLRLDIELAREVCLRDDEIDELDARIEDRCIRMLGLQHPMASDLRLVSTAMKMITDIERIGDLAVEIARIAMKVNKELGSSDVVDIPRMARAAQKMLRQSLEAYVKRDLQLVEEVLQEDDAVDAMYRELRGQLFESMKNDPESVVTDSWLLLAIHHVERIADHATNIAERVRYMVTGRSHAAERWLPEA
jgi:phosphate transport system protein